MCNQVILAVEHGSHCEGVVRNAQRQLGAGMAARVSRAFALPILIFGQGDQGVGPWATVSDVVKDPPTSKIARCDAEFSAQKRLLDLRSHSGHPGQRKIRTPTPLPAAMQGGAAKPREALGSLPKPAKPKEALRSPDN